MPALNFSRISKIPPNPWQVSHRQGINVGYTCHMAAMHWAFMALGKSQIQANAAVGEFTLATCPGCKGNAPHGSLSPREYGVIFCKSARKIPSRNQLYNMVNVGDVLITDNKFWPAHTMVVRQKRRPDHITIRGFNNIGTLGTGVRDRYDPVSHNITKDKYWKNPNTGKFGLIGVDLFVIKHDDYMRVIRTLSKRFLN